MNQYFEAVKKGGDYWNNYLGNEDLKRTHYLSTVDTAVSDYCVMRHETWASKNFPDRKKYG